MIGALRRGAGRRVVVVVALAACGGSSSSQPAPVTNVAPASTCGCTSEACAAADPVAYVNALWCELTGATCACPNLDCVRTTGNAFYVRLNAFVREHPDLAAIPDPTTRALLVELASRSTACILRLSEGR